MANLRPAIEARYHEARQSLVAALWPLRPRDLHLAALTLGASSR